MGLPLETGIQGFWDITVPVSSRTGEDTLRSSTARYMPERPVSVSGCDAPKPGGPLTTRQPAEYKWRSGYPTPLQKIGQSLLCTGSSTQIQTCIYLSQTVQYIQYMSNTATWTHKQYSMYIPTMKPTIYLIVTRVDIFTLKQYIY